MHATVQLESLPQSSSLFDRFIEIDPDRYAPHWCNVMRSAVKFSFDWWKIPRIDCEKPFIRHQITLGDIIEMMQEYKEQLEVPVPESYKALPTPGSQSLLNEMETFAQELYNMRDVYTIWLQSLLDQVRDSADAYQSSVVQMQSTCDAIEACQNLINILREADH
ncbi:hypothetical protein K503DRAFT_806224 [Rhizopogon vinicolor AM-OR11-026]|uniref:Uncharacterized protein n=1 Tax=Rhizopogon vinicolor AM-OR11-026 TaxID=1314800 RepID=A0A1B7MF69_9AGAM|nr:hypothetical protein K503DRAFT_806224 [Rhizopogon vinicolor AM-OR11-026]